MKTRMIKSLFTIACLLCSIQMLATIEVFCGYDFKVDGICYSYAPNEELACLVTYNDYGVGSTNGWYYYNNKTKYEGTIVIPEEVTYENKAYKVVGIKDYAFNLCKELTNVVIPNSVVAIGERSFYGCFNLESVVIGSGVTSIGSNAFRYCSSLRSVIIPNSVENIGRDAFNECSGLESVVIGSGVVSVSHLFSEDELPAKVIWLPNTPPDGYCDYDLGAHYYPCFGKVNYVANSSYRFPQGKTYIYDHLSSLFVFRAL